MLSKNESKVLLLIKSGQVNHVEQIVKACGMARATAKAIVGCLVDSGHITLGEHGALVVAGSVPAVKPDDLDEVHAEEKPTPEFVIPPPTKPQYHDLVTRGLNRLNKRLNFKFMKIANPEGKAESVLALATALKDFDGGHVSAMLHDIANDYKNIAEGQNESN